MVRTLPIWDRVQQPRPAIYCRGLHVGAFVSAVLGVGWYLGLAVLFLHAFCILPPCAYARCRLSMPTATSRASLLPSYNLQRRIGHSGIQINKNMGGLHPLCRKRSCLPLSKSMLYLAAPVRAQQIFFCNHAASRRIFRASMRSLQGPRTASISPGRGIARHRCGILPHGICNVSVGPQEIIAPLEGFKNQCLIFFV